MSWLLIGKKSKRNTRPASRPSRNAGGFPSAARLFRVTFFLLLLLGTVAGWAWGHGKLRNTVTSGRGSISLRVELVDLPPWMPDAASRQIVRTLEKTLTTDPFDRDALQKTADALATNPWIQKLHHVTRRPGGIVLVHADYRRPAALVRVGQTCHLIDAESVRLPYSYSLAQAPATGLPLLVGVRRDVPRIGDRWEGADLGAGLKLASLVEGQPWFPRVAALDVSNHDGRLDPRHAHLKLLTALDGDPDPANNPGIDWGRAPGEEGFYEPPTDWKLARLAEALGGSISLDRAILKLTSEPGVTLALAPPDADLYEGERYVSNVTRRRR